MGGARYAEQSTGSNEDTQEFGGQHIPITHFFILL
jgi:hypothetical protein